MFRDGYEGFITGRFISSACLLGSQIPSQVHVCQSYPIRSNSMHHLRGRLNRVVPMLACLLAQSAHVSTLSRVLEAHARLSEEISNSASCVLIQHRHCRTTPELGSNRSERGVYCFPVTLSAAFLTYSLRRIVSHSPFQSCPISSYRFHSLSSFVARADEWVVARRRRDMERRRYEGMQVYRYADV